MVIIPKDSLRILEGSESMSQTG